MLNLYFWALLCELIKGYREEKPGTYPYKSTDNIQLILISTKRGGKNK